MASSYIISAREHQALHLIANKNTYNEIASQLCIVVRYRKNLISKWGVRHTARMISKAFEVGLLRNSMFCLLIIFNSAANGQHALIDNTSHNITEWLSNSKNSSENIITLHLSTNGSGLGNSTGLRVQNFSKGLSNESLGALFQTDASILNFPSGSSPTTQVAVGLRASAKGGVIGNFAAIFGDGDVLVENKLFIPNNLGVDARVRINSNGELYPEIQAPFIDYLTVPFSEFMTEIGNHEGVSMLGNTLSVEVAETTNNHLYAPVAFPSFVNLRSLTGALATSGSVAVRLYRQTFPNTGNLAAELLMEATATINSSSTITTITDPECTGVACTVDNENYLYYIEYVGGGRLQGVRIGFQHP